MQFDFCMAFDTFDYQNNKNKKQKGKETQVDNLMLQQLAQG